MAGQRKDDDEARNQRVIFLLTKDELEAVDAYAKQKYMGQRSVLIREALIDFGVIKKSKEK